MYNSIFPDFVFLLLFVLFLVLHSLMARTLRDDVIMTLRDDVQTECAPQQRALENLADLIEGVTAAWCQGIDFSLYALFVLLYPYCG